MPLDTCPSPSQELIRDASRHESVTDMTIWRKRWISSKRGLTLNEGIGRLALDETLKPPLRLIELSRSESGLQERGEKHSPPHLSASLPSSPPGSIICASATSRPPGLPGLAFKQAACDNHNETYREGVLYSRIFSRITALPCHISVRNEGEQRNYCRIQLNRLVCTSLL